MKPKSPVSSSDLDRARALAARLAEDAPPNAPDVPHPPGGYIAFSAERFTGAVRGPAPAAPRESYAPARSSPPPPPRLETPRPAPEPLLAPAPTRGPAEAHAEDPRRPQPRAEPKVEAPRPAPPPLPPEPEPELSPVEGFEPSAAFEPAPGFDTASNAIENELAEPVLEPADNEPEPSLPPAPPLVEIEEESLGVLPDEEEAAEPPPSWGQILDDCLYLARARSALVMDRGGRVVEARGEWPKNTLEKIAVRLKSAIDKSVATATGTETSLLVELQLGAFWLTGMRVMVGDSPVLAGFLAQAPLRAEVRPALEDELLRGQPL
jgi:hypothetical protein